MSLATNVAKGGGELTATLNAQGSEWFPEWKVGLLNAKVVVVVYSKRCAPLVCSRARLLAGFATRPRVPQCAVFTPTRVRLSALC